MLGGSADLTGSNLTNTKSTPPLRVNLAGEVQRTEDGKIGRHINYGVREFGMAAVMNGITLHGGYIPYGGTFLTFSDYSRNAIRMAALMKRRVIHVFTHDSIGLGEDGPTHQSIEHAASLRLIPGLDVWRPADTAETAVAWAVALENRARPAGLPRIAVEAGVSDGWWKYGCAAVVGIDHYGESAPANVLFKTFGFTPENVAETVRAVLQRGA